MKKSVLSMFCAMIITGLFAQASLTKEDRSKAIDHLKNTQTELLKTVKGLSQEQLNFKPADEAWSVFECLEHIAISEGNIFGIVEMSLKNTPDPSMRSELQFTDDQVLGFIQSREQKVKTRPEFEPTNKFGSYEGSMDEFQNKRKANLKFMKSTDEDLRNRYFDFPFGKVDLYQVVLFMSGHTKRHTDQIKEVIAHAEFPNS